MKKKLLSALLIMLFTLLSSAYAANGDVIGNYYYTDIKTYLYYSPITSYNIGGETMIDAEILNWHYGFDVYWYEDKRILDITDKGGRFNSLQALSGELCESQNGKTGEIAGKFYETDIKTYLNKKEIKSANIGGRTYIKAEEMKEHGYDVAWDSEKRTLTITKPADFYQTETDFGLIKTTQNCRMNGKLAEWNRGIYTSSDTEIKTPSNTVLVKASYGAYIKLADVLTLLNAKAEIMEEEITVHTEFANGTGYDDKVYSYTLNITYDSSPSPKTVPIESYAQAPIDYVPKDGEYYYILDMKLNINGEEVPLVSMYGGKEYPENIIALLGELYFPAHMTAKLLGYKYGY